MKTIKQQIMKSDKPEMREDIAEYINTHSSEFLQLVASVFDTAGKEDLKKQIIGICDLLDRQLMCEAIGRAVNDQSSDVRVLGLRAVYRTRSEEFTADCLKLVRDENEPFEVRKWATHILASEHPNEYGRVLRQIARDTGENMELRREAVHALTKIDDDKTVGSLCAILGDSSEDMRKSAAWALGRIADEESIDCLLAALEDESEAVRDWSVRALRDMGAPKAVQGLIDAMKEAPPEEQVRMIRLIVEKRSEIILRSIAEFLSSPHTEVRRVAAWAMGVSPYPPAAASLEHLLDDEDARVRKYAEEALRRLGRIDGSEFESMF
ncbi:MAG: HEAT repeat domain-containing protein [Candidatus Thorarchaeota archaeon]